jgi:hypothetical protein
MPMTFKFVISVALLLLILTAFSCSCEKRDRGLLPLMPLSVGNRWDYSVYGVDSDTGELIYQPEDAFEIVNVGALDGQDYFLTNTRLAFCQMDQGLSFALYDEGEFDNLEILLLYPIPDGREYEYLSTKVYQPEFVVRMDKEDVSTPSGTYSAHTYRVHFLNGTVYLTLSFTPGVGMVQMRSDRGGVWLLSSVSLVGPEPGTGRWPPTGAFGP